MALPATYQPTRLSPTTTRKGAFANIGAKQISEITDSDMEQDLDTESPSQEDESPRFMMTEVQRSERNRKRRGHKVRHTLKMMRKAMDAREEDRNARRNRRFSGRTDSKLEKLPPEILINIMSYLGSDSFVRLEIASQRIADIWRENTTNCLWGMLRAQYAHWQSSLGCSSIKTDQQKHNLKLLLGSLQPCFWAWFAVRVGAFSRSNFLRWSFDKITENALPPEFSLHILEMLDSRLESEIDRIEKFTEQSISKEAAICLQLMRCRDCLFVREDKNIASVSGQRLSWGSRMRIIGEQSFHVKREVGRVLEILICRLAKKIGVLDDPACLRFFAGITRHVNTLGFSIVRSVMANFLAVEIADIVMWEDLSFSLYEKWRYEINDADAPLETPEALSRVGKDKRKEILLSMNHMLQNPIKWTPPEYETACRLLSDMGVDTTQIMVGTGFLKMIEGIANCGRKSWRLS